MIIVHFFSSKMRLTLGGLWFLTVFGMGREVQICQKSVTILQNLKVGLVTVFTMLESPHSVCLKNFSLSKFKYIILQEM